MSTLTWNSQALLGANVNRICKGVERIVQISSSLRDKQCIALCDSHDLEGHDSGNQSTTGNIFVSGVGMAQGAGAPHNSCLVCWSIFYDLFQTLYYLLALPYFVGQPTCAYLKTCFKTSFYATETERGIQKLMGLSPTKIILDFTSTI